MQRIISNIYNGTIEISDQFNVNSLTFSYDTTPYFSSIGSEYTISFVNLQNVIKFTKFNYDTIGLTDNRYLENYYRISRDGKSWTEWIDLKRYIDNFPIVDSKDPLFMDIKWVRSGISENGTIRLLEYSISGDIERSISNGDDIISIHPGENLIISAPYIYKVFKITDLEILPISEIDNIDIKYRYSQDNSRSWSNWEILTKENISTIRINPIRFFQIEYSITNNSSDIKNIQDINLIGDFQNVTKDYYKTNLFGIRECCQSNLYGTYDSNGNFIPTTNGNGSGGISSVNGTCDTNSIYTSMTLEDKANLYNPYQQNAATDLLTKLSTDSEQIFGHIVMYFLTEPDKNGIDYSFHEYQLYNAVCEKELKVSVDQNQFPDSQIVMNPFDLSLFESMTVHITKKQFKEAFGVHSRPSKEDFLYFCNINRMFQVDHAQQYRNFNNSAIYYKLILKKYTQKSSTQATDINVNDTMKMLSKNSTIDSLFYEENNEDKKSIANKQQLTTLSKDPIRLEYKVTINKELIENSSTIISKSNYDLSSIDYKSIAVTYRNLNPVLKKSDNLSYVIWFNINNYIMDEDYNLLNYYDSNNSLGIKINLSNDVVNIIMNSYNYSYNLINNTTGNTSLDENIWYCYLCNIDQRNNKIEQFIYKRNVEDEDDASKLSSNILKKLYYNIQDIYPIEFEMEGYNCQLLASDMKVTNIRMFSDVIPESVHNKILNQYIIGNDSKYLIFGDNATTKIYLPIFPLFE